MKKYKNSYELEKEEKEICLARAKEIFEKCNLDKEMALKREEQIAK